MLSDIRDLIHTILDSNFVKKLLKEDVSNCMVYIQTLLNQGRPVNSNREAACFIAKLGGGRNSCRNLRKMGEGLSVKYSYIRITLLWHQRSICFMVLGGGGMDAPADNLYLCGVTMFNVSSGEHFN
jgi:hypothetical protein